MRRNKSSDISRDKSYLQFARHFHDALPASCAFQWEPRTAIVYIERSLPVGRKRRTSRWGRETPELDRRGALRANLPDSLSLCSSHVAVSSWVKRRVEMVTLAARFKPRGMETRRRTKGKRGRGWMMGMKDQMLQRRLPLIPADFLLFSFSSSLLLFLPLPCDKREFSVIQGLRRTRRISLADRKSDARTSSTRRAA